MNFLSELSFQSGEPLSGEPQFRGASILADVRSLAFQVACRDPKTVSNLDAPKMLTDEEVEKWHTSVVESVRKKYGAVLRTECPASGAFRSKTRSFSR